MSGDLLFVLGVCLVAFVVWILNWTPEDPTPPDMDRMTRDERIDALKRKQSAVRARMKREGIRSLLDGHPGWANVNPMRDERPVPENVVELRRKS